MKQITILLAALIGLVLLAAWPTPAYAQDEEAGGATTAVTSDSISGTVQITAESPQAIRSLLEGEAAIPGGYGGYGRAIFAAFFFGSLGGLVYELLRLQGNLELPHRYSAEDVPDDDEYRLAPYAIGKWSVDAGFLARMFVGGMAALAVLLVISPPERLKFIAVVVIAGSAGASVFDTMRARLTASLAVADAADLRAKGDKIDAKLQELDGLARKLKAQAGVVTFEPAADDDSLPVPAGAPAPADAVVAENIAILDEIERTLGEAKGIRSTMDRR